jgi:hypothetical protein
VLYGRASWFSWSESIVADAAGGGEPFRPYRYAISFVLTLQLQVISHQTFSACSGERILFGDASGRAGIKVFAGEDRTKDHKKEEERKKTGETLKEGKACTSD